MLALINPAFLPTMYQLGFDFHAAPSFRTTGKCVTIFLKTSFFLAMSDLYLVSRKTALVAIDLQNAIMGISAAPYPATQVVQRNRKIADELRARGGLVVWVRVNLNQFLQLPSMSPRL